MLPSMAICAENNQVMESAISAVLQGHNMVNMKFLIGCSTSFTPMTTHAFHDGSDLTPFLFLPTRICVP